jgi:HK97 family phage portal protein
MRIFGFTIARTADLQKQIGLSSILNNRGGWLPIIREPFAGAWQQGVEIKRDLVLTQHAVFACMTLIASDIAKLRCRLVERDANGIWKEASNPAYSPVLRKPNGIQTRIQFWESWMLSKLSNGNAYVLKGRDARDVVTTMHVLDPNRVQPLVSPGGEVFYRLGSDNVSGLETDITVPAREIIHDRMNCLFHPLVGLSPIFAAALAAQQSLNIQTDAANFFANGAMPAGVLTAPGEISESTAREMKEEWDAKFSGKNAGKVAVLGSGLKFEAMRMQSTDAQLVEQLRWTADVVCSAFHVPPYKIGIGAMPSYNNIQALNVEYYSQALQIQIESAELLLDEGLAIKDPFGTEFDIDDLLRMDTVTQTTAAKEAVAGSIMAPNEGRRKLNLPPVKGGEEPLSQQQNWPLGVLAERPPPWESQTPSSVPPEDDEEEEPDDDEEEEPDDEEEEPDDEEEERAYHEALYNLFQGAAA